MTRERKKERKNRNEKEIEVETFLVNIRWKKKKILLVVIKEELTFEYYNQRERKNCNNQKVFISPRGYGAPKV